ncbi:MAG: hypothetical protein AB7F74_20785 [Parvibaculaceae bacterium]
MTDEEFAKLYSKTKWPTTFEGKRATRIVPGSPFEYMRKFPDTPLDEDRIPPLSRGELRSRVPSSRERMFNVISSTLYGDPPAGTKENTSAHRLADALDFTPIGALNQAYDTGHLVGEGRITDAAYSSGLGFLPAWRKSPTGFFNPIPKRPRHISEDYPNGAGLNADGEITHDMENRPLDAAYRPGRWRLDEPDHALRPNEIERVGEQVIEGPIKRYSKDYFDEGTVGETWSFSEKPGFIQILDSLPPEEAERVVAHEVGHAIDMAAGKIPTDGLDDELNFVYNAMQTGKERKYLQNRPEDGGYGGHDVPREKMAEAIRAYMTDPNYLKTVAAKTAARIRQYVNSHPQLSKIIQFNSLAAGGALAVGSAGQTEDSHAADLPVQRGRPRDIIKGVYSNFGPSVPFELVDGAERAGTYGIIQLKKVLARRGLVPQAPRSRQQNNLVRALMALETRQKTPRHGDPR